MKILLTCIVDISYFVFMHKLGLKPLKGFVTPPWDTTLMCDLLYVVYVVHSQIRLTLL